MSVKKQKSQVRDVVATIQNKDLSALLKTKKYVLEIHESKKIEWMNLRDQLDVLEDIIGMIEETEQKEKL